MSPSEPRLEQIQRWMQSVIVHPGGVAEGVDSPEARQHLDVTLDTLPSVIARSRRLSSADRLEIYVNAYYTRLMECLEEEYAVTRHALGDDLFGAVAFGYLQHYPSQSYTLNQLGARFSHYLAESRLHAAATPGGAGPTWPEFIIELATLERSLYEVYDGPGMEREGAFNPARLAALAPDTWDAVRLELAPCLRLHRFEHPVHAYWAERKSDGEPLPPGPLPPGPRPTWLAIHRRDYVVERHELSAAEYALLAELARGSNLAGAVAAAANAAEDGEPLESQLGRWFARFASTGYFARVVATPAAD